MVDFQLNSNLDLHAIEQEYAANGRVRINDLLNEEAVDDLYHYLNDRTDWWHMMTTDVGLIELSRPERARMSKKRLAALDREGHALAQLGFQYRYEGLRVPDPSNTADAAIDLLADFARLMSSNPMLQMLRTVTGATELVFTDGHATAFGPGDFLTGHDDDVPGKDRLAAYVFGLTPQWRPEWGGLLLFHGTRDATAFALEPRFNTLDLFAVPQRHSVSMVTPAARDRRYAVTGWLRKVPSTVSEAPI